MTEVKTCFSALSGMATLCDTVLFSSFRDGHTMWHYTYPVTTTALILPFCLCYPPSHLNVWNRKIAFPAHDCPYDDPQSSRADLGLKPCLRRKGFPTAQWTKVLSIKPFKQSLAWRDTDTDCHSEAYNLGTLYYFHNLFKREEIQHKVWKNSYQWQNSFMSWLLWY